jgi:hypothetical protein
MAEESPSEREDRLQRAEERLQKQHTRLSDPPPKTSVGSTFGGVASFFGEHKMLIFIGIGIAVVIYVLFQSRNNNASNTNSTSQTAGTGSLANAGYQDQGTAYALTQLGQQLNNLTAIVGNPPTGATGPTGPAGPAGPAGKPGPTGPAGKPPPNPYVGILSSWPFGTPTFGKKVKIGTTTYEIGGGTHGVFAWGVPVPSGKTLTLAQFNAVPIGLGPGQKIALYGSRSMGGSPTTRPQVGAPSLMHESQSYRPSAAQLGTVNPTGRIESLAPSWYFGAEGNVSDNTVGISSPFKPLYSNVQSRSIAVGPRGPYVRPRFEPDQNVPQYKPLR